MFKNFNIEQYFFFHFITSAKTSREKKESGKQFLRFTITLIKIPIKRNLFRKELRIA